MKHSPKISVIIPVFNTEKYLSECINSVLNQTYKDFEIILIDDGSIDNSGELCDQFATQNPNIIVAHQSNSGLSEARNRGIKLAAGDWLTFLDSDDYLAKNFLAELIKLAKKHDAEIAISAQNELSTNQQLRNMGENYRRATLTTEQCLDRMLREQGINLSACAKLYQKSLFKNITFPPHRLHEDVGTTYRLVLNAKTIIYDPKPLYFYRENITSITHNFNLQKLDLIELTDQMCDELDPLYPNLHNSIIKRRAHARFSILRQLVNAPATPTVQRETKKILNYLKTHKNDILKNPVATHRDKIAMRAALIGPTAFKSLWNIYIKIR